MLADVVSNSMDQLMALSNWPGSISNITPGLNWKAGLRNLIYLMVFQQVVS